MIQISLLAVNENVEVVNSKIGNKIRFRIRFTHITKTLIIRPVNDVNLPTSKRNGG